MVSSLSKLLLLAGLASQSLAATTSSSSKPSTTSPKPSTTTVKPSTTSASPPSKTACAYAQTTISKPSPKAVCNGRGSLSKAAEIDKLCYDYNNRGSYQGQPDCYHSCSRDSRCVSFGWDPYNMICHLYSKSLADQGFKTNETSLFLWDLRSCYVCDQPPQPVKSACPATPVEAPESQKKKYTCGAIGDLTKGNPVATFTSGYGSFQGCYESCVDYERSGLCKSFTYAYTTSREYECKLYNQPISQLGFQPDQYYGAEAYDLRGCYNCTLPPTQTKEDCQATDIPVNPHIDNAGFQQTEYNTVDNFTYPIAWGTGADPNLYSGKQGTSGNLVGAMRNPGSYNQFINNIYDFDQNPYTPYHLYNVTYEWALPSYKVANETASGKCRLYFGPTTDPGLQLSAKLVGTKLQKRGPFLFDAQGQGPGIYAQLAVECAGAQQQGDNVTVWFDNVQYTQYGKVVAGVGAP